jgi:hypothetical protein
VTPVPSRLEYGYGFDLAATWLAGARYPLLAVVSTPEFVDHVVARAAGPLVFACEDARTRDRAVRRLGGGDVLAAVAEGSQVRAPLPAAPPAAAPPAAPPAAPEPPGFGGVLWAAPQPGTWRDRLHAIGRVLDEDGRLCVLTGTSTGAVTGLLRPRGGPGEPAALERSLRAGLGAGGWRVTRSRGLGGLTSVGWAVAGRLAALARRPDLADRAERAHHLAVDDEAGASYALLLARPGRLGAGGAPA